MNAINICDHKQTDEGGSHRNYVLKNVTLTAVDDDATREPLADGCSGVAPCVKSVCMTNDWKKRYCLR